MEGVDGAQVERRVVEPALIARHAVLLWKSTLQSWAREHDTLLRQPRAHRVHRLEAGDQPVDAARAAFRSRDARVALEACAPRAGARDHCTPTSSARGARVLRQQVVQDRRARCAAGRPRRAAGAPQRARSRDARGAPRRARAGSSARATSSRRAIVRPSSVSRASFSSESSRRRSGVEERLRARSRPGPPRAIAASHEARLVEPHRLDRRARAPSAQRRWRRESQRQRRRARSGNRGAGAVGRLHRGDSSPRCYRVGR